MEQGFPAKLSPFSIKQQKSQGCYDKKLNQLWQFGYPDVEFHVTRNITQLIVLVGDGYKPSISSAVSSKSAKGMSLNLFLIIDSI